MSALHILFISSWYPSRNYPTHGIFNRAFASAVALRSQVTVLHVSPHADMRSGFVTETYDDQGIFTVQVYYAAGKRLPLFLGKMVQHFRRLSAYNKGYNLIRKTRNAPQVIQLNVVLPAGPGAAMLSRKHRIPLVVNECWTGYDPLDGRYNSALQKTLTFHVLRYASRLMPVTAYMQELLERHGIRRDFTVIPNVVDVDVFKPGAPRAPDGSLTFIHVSALDDAQKNVTGILQAVAALAAGMKQLRLVIAGDGPDGQKLRDLAGKLGLNGVVRFAGQLQPAALAEEISKADALVMFSNYESFCVAVPEALACGKPVITSNAGGIMSYFTSDLGIVVPAGDTAALVMAMREYAGRRKEFDAQLLRDFVVKRFSPAVICVRLHQVYEEVIAKA